MPTTTFQQGTNYKGTIDTSISQAKPTSAGGTGQYLYDNGDPGALKQSLLTFSNIFGSGAGQIPVGATITSATLTLTVYNPTETGGGIYRMTSAWTAGSTWNSLGNGVQVGTETVASPDVNVGSVGTGTQNFDVTTSLQAWLSGATSATQANAANLGWLFSNTTTDNWYFSSSEGPVAPILTVTYTMPGANPPQLALAGPVSHVEGTSGTPTSYVFTVNRTGDTSGAVSVDYAVAGSGGAAANASDFAGGLLPSGTISFAAGETSKTITVNVAADSVFESDESFILSLSNPTNGASITGATATGSILNDDAAPQLSLTGSISQAEGTGAAPTAYVFTVDRTGDSSGAVSVNYAVTGSGVNPASAADFAAGVLPSGTLSFAAGETSKTITVNVAGDSVFESDETFTLSLSSPTNGASIASGTATGTIVNDDNAPQLSLEGPVSHSEGTSGTPTSYVFTVDRTGDSSGVASVNYSVAGSGAKPANASDFVGGVLPSGTVSFAAGETSKTITVNVAADSNFESDETFTLSLSNPTGGTSITGGSATGTIVNDDQAPQLAFEGSVSQSEGTSGSPTSYVFTVDRTGDSSGAVTVNYAVAGSGANPADASDFAGGVLPSGTVSFAAGETSKTITVNVAADSNTESNETFTLTLSNPTGGAAITGGTATGTIVNDDNPPPPVFVTTTFKQGANYTGTIDTYIDQSHAGASGSTGATLYTVAGSTTARQTLLEFTNLFGSGSGQIPVGAIITSATLTVNVGGGSVDGGGIYRMTANWSGTSTWNSLGNGIQIGTETVGTADVTVGAIGTGAQTFDVTQSLQAWLSGASTATQANAANKGWVFSSTNTDSWNFSSSEGAAPPVLTVTYDMPGAGPPAQLALAGPVSQNEGSSESPTAFTFTVNRTGDTTSAASATYTVTGSGNNPAVFSDFSGGVLPTGTVNFAAGETSKTITINVVGDTSVENTKAFTVTLSNPSYGAMVTGSTAVGTILNDDASSGLRGVNIIDGSSYGNGDPNSPGHWGSTDPTDIAYDPADHSFYLVDSEVDETPMFGTVNMWKLDSTGHLIAPVTIESMTDEPTGIALWVTPTGAEHLFITDDNKVKILEVDAANPTVVLNSITTTKFGCADPEDIAVNPLNGNLFVMSENDHTIYEITRTGTLVSKTVLPDTFVPHTDPLSQDAGAEAIAYDPVKDVFWVAGGFSPDIFEISRSGQILNVINILEQYTNPSLVGTPQGVYPKGIELAPSSDGSGHMSLWVTDYGRDQYPDGRLIEIMLNDSGGATATSMSVQTAQTTALQPSATDAGLHRALMPETRSALDHFSPHMTLGHEHWSAVQHPDYLF